MPKKDEKNKGEKSIKSTTAKSVKSSKAPSKTAKKKPSKKGGTKKKSGGGISKAIGREHKKAQKIKISRKEMRRDELKETSATILEYLTAHSNKVLTIIGTVIVLLLIVILVNFYKSSRKTVASELFTKARNLYDLGLSETPPSIASLKVSLDMFEGLISNYKGGVEEALAYFYKGNIYFNLQDYENAIQAYNKFLSSDVKNETYMSIAKTNIAYSYENISDFEKAIELFKNISNTSKGFLKKSSLLDLGMAYEKINKDDEAVKVYQDFIKDYPTSILIEKVQERINSIQAK
jgi:tetratricopeptide (TPR) repeat protein